MKNIYQYIILAPNKDRKTILAMVKVKSIKNILRSIVIVPVLFLVACSTAPEKQYQDPLESANRVVYGFNQQLDNFVFKPVAQGYRFLTPRPVELGVRNFFANLFYPTVFINQFLQGKPGLGVEGMSRFVFNSTLGLGGLIDISTKMGMPAHDEDFGQTFAKWGVGSGPFLMVPVFGAYTMRDGLGDIIATRTNPMFYIENDALKYGLFGGVLIDRSAALLEARELVTGDKYLFTRDAYLQKRKFLVSDGSLDEEDPFLDD